MALTDRNIIKAKNEYNVFKEYNVFTAERRKLPYSSVKIEHDFTGLDKNSGTNTFVGIERKFFNNCDIHLVILDRNNLPIPLSSNTPKFVENDKVKGLYIFTTYKMDQFTYSSFYRALDNIKDICLNDKNDLKLIYDVVTANSIIKKQVAKSFYPDLYRKGFNEDGILIESNKPEEARRIIDIDECSFTIVKFVPESTIREKDMYYLTSSDVVLMDSGTYNNIKDTVIHPYSEASKTLMRTKEVNEMLSTSDSISGFFFDIRTKDCERDFYIPFMGKIHHFKSNRTNGESGFFMNHVLNGKVTDKYKLSYESITGETKEFNPNTEDLAVLKALDIYTSEDAALESRTPDFIKRENDKFKLDIAKVKHEQELQFAKEKNELTAKFEKEKKELELDNLKLKTQLDKLSTNNKVDVEKAKEKTIQTSASAGAASDWRSGFLEGLKWVGAGIACIAGIVAIVKSGFLGLLALI